MAKSKPRVVVRVTDPASPVWGYLRASVPLLYRMPFGIKSLVHGHEATLTCDESDALLLNVSVAEAIEALQSEGGTPLAVPYVTEEAHEYPHDPASERQLVAARIMAVLKGIGMDGFGDDVLRHTNNKYYAVFFADRNITESRGTGGVRVYSEKYIQVTTRQRMDQYTRTYGSLDHALEYLVSLYHLRDLRKANAVPMRPRREDS